jgi:hypothetical protein
MTSSTEGKGYPHSSIRHLMGICEIINPYHTDYTVWSHNVPWFGRL